MTTFSATAADLKIGFINMVKLMQEAPQAKAASARLEKEFGPRQKKLESDAKAFDKKAKDFERDRGMMSPDTAERTERALVSEQRQIKLQETTLKEDFNIRRRAEMEKVQKHIRDAIKKIGEKEKFDLILYEGAAFTSDRIDITNQLLSELR
jgi:outer membrane protein